MEGERERGSERKSDGRATRGFAHGKKAKKA